MCEKAKAPGAAAALVPLPVTAETFTAVNEAAIRADADRATAAKRERPMNRSYPSARQLSVWNGVTACSTPTARWTGSMRGHTDHGLVEMDVAGRPVEPGCAVREDAAVGGDQPVTRTGRRRRHADHRLVQRPVALGPEELRPRAEGEHAAVRRHEPVTITLGRAGHADDRLVQPDVAGRSVERGVAEAEDAAVGGDHPIALTGRRGGHADDGL